MTDKPVTRRLWALVNIALIPYVAVRFPREAKRYASDSFRSLVDGRMR